MTARSTGPATSFPNVSVVVVTYERPDCLALCLEHLGAQTRPPLEVLVVDASTGDESARLVRQRFPEVAYAVNGAGLGTTATSRSIGYEHTSGEVLAFVDDDAYAEPEWLEHLIPPYADPSVGGVGGRQIRRQPGELTAGLDDIGRLHPDGTLSGNFAADPGELVEVDHLLGANMSFRRRALDRIGGIRDGYHGTCLCEETDISLRVTGAGYRLIYTPDAVVEHVGGRYAKGQRFDVRYAYWAQKNTLILLVRNFGPTDRIVRAFLRRSLRTGVTEASTRLSRAGGRLRGHDGRGATNAAGSALLRGAVLVAGTFTGMWTGLRLAAGDRRHRTGAGAGGGTEAGAGAGSA